MVVVFSRIHEKSPGLSVIQEPGIGLVYSQSWPAENVVLERTGDASSATLMKRPLRSSFTTILFTNRECCLGWSGLPSHRIIVPSLRLTAYRPLLRIWLSGLILA
jgi:hypothetical protein